MKIGKLFSFEGRIGRKTFWLTIAALAPVQFGWLVLLGAQQEGRIRITNDSIAILCFIGLIVIPAIILPWISLTNVVKRWHDRGKSGMWVLISVGPYLFMLTAIYELQSPFLALVGLIASYIGAIWSLIELGFLPGTRGVNGYEEPDFKLPAPEVEYTPPNPNVRIGQSPEEVKGWMGEPDTISSDQEGRTHYQYPSMKVTFRNDKVAAVEYLRTPKQV